MLVLAMVAGECVRQEHDWHAKTTTTTTKKKKIMIRRMTPAWTKQTIERQPSNRARGWSS